LVQSAAPGSGGPGADGGAPENGGPPGNGGAPEHAGPVPLGDALAWLGSASYQDVRDGRGLAGPPPRTLLYLLLRHAVLATHATVALRIRLAAGAAQP